MTKEEYIKIMQEKDITPVLFFYYRMKGGKLDIQNFKNYFAFWLINVVGIYLFTPIIEGVVYELNKHFRIY